MFSLLQRISEVVWGPSETEEQADNAVPKEKEQRELAGRVTSVNETGGTVDHSVYFDLTTVVGGIRPKVGDSVLVAAERDHNEAGWTAVKVQVTEQWQASEESTSHNLVGYIIEKGHGSCIAYCNQEEVAFSRQMVVQGYVPHRGDWVMLQVLTQGGQSMVSCVKPLRQHSLSGVIEQFTGRQGVVGGDAMFTLAACVPGYFPRNGDQVIAECIECRHPRHSWRAMKIVPKRKEKESVSAGNVCAPLMGLQREEQGGMVLKGTAEFGEVFLGESHVHVLVLSNEGDQPRQLLSCAVLSQKDQLSVKVERAEGGQCVILPGTSIDISIHLSPNTLGWLATALLLKFEGFIISRPVRGSVIDDTIQLLEPSRPYQSSARRKTFGPSYQDRLRACNVPGQRPVRKMLRLPHRLKLYDIPDDMRQSVDLKEEVTLVRPVMAEPLHWENYTEHFSTLLFLEEIQMEKDIRDFDMPCASMYGCGPYLSLGVPGLAEGRPSLIVGDRVIVCEPGGDDRSQHYEGYIHEVRGGDVLLKFCEDFHQNFHNEDYDVMFTFNRTPLRRMHHAVGMVRSVNSQVVFPTHHMSLPPLLRFFPCPTDFFNPSLNTRQQSAVVRILGAQGRPAPYIVFGPPGTGKTVTIVEAILQVYRLSNGSSRILACTPSNSAADLIAERLIASGYLEKGILVRLNALNRSQPPPPSVLPYCMETDSIDVASRHRVIVATCVSSGLLCGLALPVGHFTHVLVDEAGQATEPECLVPIMMLAGSSQQAVLAGDPHQLGPILRSTLALAHGMGMSLLERLMMRDPYQRDEKKFADHGSYDPLLVTKLVCNYRAHPALLNIYSELFYHNELEACADLSLSHSLCEWQGLPSAGFPFLFHGVMGEDMREGNSPSWFNPVEAVQVVRYTQQLLDGSTHLSESDIGIITPYRKQVEKIRMLLERTGVEEVKVGSVEEFQGQERQAIIISTVRSSVDLLEFDLLHSLGFVSNCKRFNVAISRAQALMIVVGNPLLLVQDQYWSQLLSYAVDHSAYIGCALSEETKELLTIQSHNHIDENTQQEKC